jgi:hypothetical protein
VLCQFSVASLDEYTAIRQSLSSTKTATIHQCPKQQRNKGRYYRLSECICRLLVEWQIQGPEHKSISGKVLYHSKLDFLPLFFIIQEVFSTEVDMDFNGKHEEDAHEFQTLLLDKLAEDVNIVLNPAYSQIDYIAPSRKISGNLVQQKANDYEKRQRAFSSSIVNKIFKVA